MAIGPIDYLGGMPQVDFARDIQGGLQIGAAFRQRREEIAQAEAARQQAAQYEADIAAFNANPSARAAAALAAKYPKNREAYKQSWDQTDEVQRREQGQAALQTAFALESGNPDAAKKVIQSRITALENAGQDATHEKLILGTIDSNPAAVRSELLRWAAFTQDPEKFAENFGKLGVEARAAELQPDAVRKGKADADKAGSDATTAGVTAKYAERNALADLETKGWNLKAIQGDIEFKRNQTQIGYLNAKIARENNAIQKQKLQLELDKAVTERDDKVREKVAKVEGAVTSMDNMLNTVERLLANDELNDVLGSVEGRMPGISDGESDAVSLIEQLGSQAFLSQVPNIQGMGALSNAEGAKLEAAFQNFGRKQSEKQFRANLDEVRRLVGKARDTVSKRYGVPIGSPDIPAAKQPQTPAIPDGWSVQER